MSRKVRHVPADWKHPVYTESNAPYPNRVGRPIPLFDGSYKRDAEEWDEGWAKWQEGLCESYGTAGKWAPIDPEHAGLRYTDYAGTRPSPDDYMPDWPEADRTHLMMYETTSEGTPISPAFATPEELARWLADNGASAFGGSKATYEQWLFAARGGWSPSAVVVDGQIQSGVEAMSARATT